MAKYQDLNTSYRKSIVDNKNVLIDMANIKKDLERLLKTGKGEVPFNRDYGTSLKTLLFENDLDPSDVRMFLYMDITNFEPRINLNPTDIDIEKIDNHTYSIKCNFTVPSLSDTSGTASAVLKDE